MSIDVKGATQIIGVGPSSPGGQHQRKQMIEAIQICEDLLPDAYVTPIPTPPLLLEKWRAVRESKGLFALFAVQPPVYTDKARSRAANGPENSA